MKIRNLLPIILTLVISSCSIQSTPGIQSTTAPSITSNPPSRITTSTDISPTTPLSAATRVITGIETQDPVLTTTMVPSSISPDHPINLPAGFGIGIFTRGLKSPRMMAIGPDGWLYVTERGAGRVIRLADRDQNGEADGIEIVADGFNGPSSIAFHPDGSLYVSETNRIWKLSNPEPNGKYQDRQVIIDNLPSNGGHSTRTLLFNTDGSELYVSIGSSCNVCIESDNRRATIMVYDPDGSNGRVYAFGLRNAVGITFRPGTQELWATNNGRDNLGDDIPPETVYHVLAGNDYGWPYCHAGRIIDPDFGNSSSCNQVQAPMVEMQAHMAPLGLNFYTGTQFPPEYQGSLFIALHGSWNRSVAAGYKVMRVPVTDGQVGLPENFATGWLNPDGSKWGRPVDVITGPDGSLFVSDDSGGVIYRIFYSAP